MRGVVLCGLVGCGGPPGSKASAPTMCDNTVYYLDLDGDGVGAGNPLTACAPLPGTVLYDGDCDDTNPTRFPRAPEVCNGQDDDCDGNVDSEDEDAQGLVLGFADADGDGFGAGEGVRTCPDTPGFGLDGDCDDADPAVPPPPCQAVADP